MASTWCCKEHKISSHDIFLNYRVASEAQLAKTLYLTLSNKKRSDEQNINVFWDHVCLNPGEKWKEGFIHGLESSALIIFLISEAGLERIKNADKTIDNVLLEYEQALLKWNNKTASILPILVGSIDEKRAYHNFNLYGTDIYPDAPHIGSGKNIRQTMTELFQIQAVALRDLETFPIAEILYTMDKSLRNLNRLKLLPPSEKKVLEDWTCDELITCLEIMYLGEYSASFKKNAINGHTFKTLTVEKFSQLGVENPFHLEALKHLQEEPSATAKARMHVNGTVFPLTHSPTKKDCKKHEWGDPMCKACTAEKKQGSHPGICQFTRKCKFCDLDISKDPEVFKYVEAKQQRDRDSLMCDYLSLQNLTTKFHELKVLDAERLPYYAITIGDGKKDCVNVEFPRVGTYGPSGAGKSQLINRLLGDDFIPVGNDLSSCSTCPIELETNRDLKDFRMTMFCLKREEWMKKRILFASRLQEKEQDNEEEVEENPDTQEWENALLILKHVYGAEMEEGSEQNKFINELLLESFQEPKELQQFFSSQMIRNFKEIKDCARALKMFGSKAELNTLPYWPLVYLIRVEGPFRKLPPNVCLIDSPGVGDFQSHILDRIDCLLKSFSTQEKLFFLSPFDAKLLREMKDFWFKILDSGKFKNFSVVATKIDRAQDEKIREIQTQTYTASMRKFLRDEVVRYHKHRSKNKTEQLANLLHANSTKIHICSTLKGKEIGINGPGSLNSILEELSLNYQKNIQSKEGQLQSILKELIQDIKFSKVTTPLSSSLVDFKGKMEQTIKVVPLEWSKLTDNVLKKIKDLGGSMRRHYGDSKSFQKKVEEISTFVFSPLYAQRCGRAQYSLMESALRAAAEGGWYYSRGVTARHVQGNINVYSYLADSICTPWIQILSEISQAIGEYRKNCLVVSSRVSAQLEILTKQLDFKCSLVLDLQSFDAVIGRLDRLLNEKRTGLKLNLSEAFSSTISGTFKNLRDFTLSPLRFEWPVLYPQLCKKLDEIILPLTQNLESELKEFKVNLGPLFQSLIFSLFQNVEKISREPRAAEIVERQQKLKLLERMESNKSESFSKLLALILDQVSELAKSNS